LPIPTIDYEIQYKKARTAPTLKFIFSPRFKMISNNKNLNKLLLFWIITPLAACMLQFVHPIQTGAQPATPESFADLAEKSGPTVVNIYTTQIVKSQRLPYHDFFNDNDQNMPEMFKRFFGQQQPHGQAPQREQKRTSLGSGVIVSSDGYILTNNHVVEGADTINIRLSNFEEYEAKIIGRDPKTDIALVKIKPQHPLPTITFGDSDKLRVGDWVIAIGNPYGFEQTVTAGIVSGKGRSIGNGPYANFIQTDASINPGNSGGPLIDTNGKMVGVNSAIYSQSGGNIGIGFAIPVNMAQNIMTQLRDTGTVTRGWLGVMIQHVTPELAKEFNLERPIGALVGEVSPDSPAEKAGIKSGDVIIAFNGKEISQMSMLPAIVAQTAVGSKAEVIFIRKGKEKKVSVTISKLEEDQKIFGAAESDAEENLGLTVQEITPELAKSLGLKESTGLLVANAEPGTPAFEAGIKRGDLILEVNRQALSDLKTYIKIIQSAKKGDSLLFLIKRENHTQFVVIKLQ
jgi:serine protease Do